MNGLDKQWRLDELFDERLRARVMPALEALVDASLVVDEAAGNRLWGKPGETGVRVPLVLELDTLGWLGGPDAAASVLPHAAQCLNALLVSQWRYRLAADLHLAVVAEDYEALKREHARLLASEARYKRLAGELEARVAAQLAELQRRQHELFEARRLAAVGRLAAGVAHEINNPLGFIKSNLATLARYLDQFAALRARLDQEASDWLALDLDDVLEDGKALLGECQTGLQRIARIVEELKGFAHLDGGGETSIDLNACLRRAAEAIKPHLPPTQEITLDLAPLPSLRGEPARLNQCFYELLENAVQALRDAGRDGAITVTSSHDPERGVVVRIRDQGCGMSADQLVHVFEPFYTTRVVGKGTGLGLFAVRNTVLAMGGQIDLDSAPGLGTTVTLVFPVPS